MQFVTFEMLAYFVVLSIFVFYQQLHTRNFRGASQGFGFLLTLSALLGTLAQVALVVYFGWKLSWIGALVVGGVGVLVGGFIGPLIERMIGGLVISFAAFVGIPYCAYRLYEIISIVAK